MKILFVCGREPQYSRNRVILSALKKNFEIIECTSTLKFTPLRYLSIFFKFLKNKHKADKIFIGFLGQPLVLLARLFSKKEITTEKDPDGFTVYGLAAWTNKLDS